MSLIQLPSRAQIAADPVLRENVIKQMTFVGQLTMRRDFVKFCKRAWIQVAPQKLVWNWHLDAICEHLVYMTQGEIRFLMITLPPRHTKSLIASVLWPVWDWLHRPGTQFLCASVDERLSLDFARLSRRVIESQWFKTLYGGEFYLLDDENQGRQYRNSKGGMRIAVSAQGRVIGSGGDVQIADDVHTVKKVEADTTRQATLAWHDNEWRSRLNNPKTAQKLYIGQRTHENDVYGHVIAQEGKRWVQLVLPLEMDLKRRCITYLNDGTGVAVDAKPIFQDPRAVEGELLDPKRMDAVTAKYEKDIMSDRAWNAQYQQQPEGQGGLILKRNWWRQWVWPEWHANAGQERPLPEFFEVIQVYDTAFEEKEEADFSARTTWGIFTYRETEVAPRTGQQREGQMRTCAMLLDMMEERLSYPDLREEAIRSNDDFDPDWVLIEKKASGHSLIQELKRKGLPVKAVGLAGSGGRAGRQGDLIARAHEASLMLEKGCIWYCPRNWAFRVIDHAAKFPAGDHDDITATLVIAWQYMRRFYDLTLPDDDADETEINPFNWQKQRRYA
jgi:predicted phage terminase large subunit-like protein